MMTTCRGVLSRIEFQTEATPDALAAICEDGRITYSALNRRANQLAHCLIGLGIGSDRIVGVSLERSIDMVVALLAVLKAGGAYIWLDPAYPRARLEFMIDDAKPEVVIIKNSLPEHLPSALGERSFCLDLQAERLSAASIENPAVEGNPDDLAYVIYTSGSTGQPKGIAMGWRALSNLLEWQLNDWTPPAAARTLQFASLNFDVSVQEIFSTLCAGGTLIMTSEETRRDPVALLRFMLGRKVERIFLPFVALQQLAKAFEAEQIIPADLRDVITAGEQLQITPQIRALFKALPHCTLHNQYGPAESHVVTALTLGSRPEDWPLLPSIGRPIAGASIHILDEQQRSVADGEPGEICIGGLTVARGYLNRKQLTAERFVRDPFSDDPRERLYRSGDLGRLLPDGNIQYLGRGDHQVKIRGVRVELGEVEAVMSQHPGVLQAVVCVKEQEVGDKRLIAYLVPNPSSLPKRDDLRCFLESKLPPQFVPSAFIVMPSIPLTPSGKVDRLALTSTPEASVRTLYEVETRDPKPPANAMQSKLIAIWEKLLNKRPIGIEANFFEIGGDSLLAVQLSADIHKKFGRKIPAALIFRAPTIEQLARALSTESKDDRLAALIEFQSSDSTPPFFCAPGFVDLARRLGPDQPFYGLNLELLYEIQNIETGIQEWAMRCVHAIRQLQPCGPYFLGGSSGAAMHALEIAHQLQAAGEKIGLLAFFDPPPPSHTISRPQRSRLARLRLSLGWYRSRLGYLLRLGPSEGIAYIKDSVDRILTDWAWHIRAFRDPAARRVLLMDAAYSPPKGLAAPLVIFLPRDSSFRDKPEDDPRLHWRDAVSGSFEVYEVPGRHSTYMRDPHVQTVAKNLRSCIDKALVSSAVLSLTTLIPA